MNKFDYRNKITNEMLLCYYKNLEYSFNQRVKELENKKSNSQTKFTQKTKCSLKYSVFVGAGVFAAISSIYVYYYPTEFPKIIPVISGCIGAGFGGIYGINKNYLNKVIFNYNQKNINNSIFEEKKKLNAVYIAKEKLL